MSSVDSAPSAPDRVSVVPLVPAWRVDRAYTYSVPEKLRGKLAIGTLVRVPFGHRRVRAVVVDDPGAEEPGELEDVAAVVVAQSLTPPPLDRLVDWLANRYVTPRSICLLRTIPPRVRAKPEPAVPLKPAPVHSVVSHLEDGDRLLEAIRSGGSGAWVLRPVPSTDRGELISELVSAAAEAGGAALVAVPEVRYGAPVLDALAALWPEAARIDSSEDDAERAKAWLRLADGHGLGLGGRATVLAPAPDVRLIVVDEAHHRSYKEDRSPRYDARRVALERARLQGAICVFVSATPSLEHGHRAASGEWGSVEPSRADRRAARPVVELVETPEDRALSPQLHERIASTLRGGGRVALLALRRGFARTLWCAACRRSLRCPRCEAGLAFDRSPARVRCPRCAFTADPPAACPSCGGTEWRFLGAGTDRLEEQLGKSFPRAKIARMDADVLAAGDPDPRAKPDVYVTTWVGTKSAFRPDVSLVGVLDADALLRRPDWRAAEDGYQALAAMAEWAGPAAAGGRLVLQTTEPAHHAIQAVARGDYDFFLRRELEARRELGYPPFNELVKLSARGPQARQLIDEANEVCRAAGARVLGPIPVRAPGAAEEELQTLVKCRDALAVTPGLRGILARSPAGSRLRVDVDPR